MVHSSYAYSSSKRVVRRVLLAAMATGAVFAHSCSDITTSTLLCEDAAARIYACCSSTPQIDCHDNGCAQQRPDFAPATAKCIRSASCETLRSAGLCDVTDWNIPSSASCQNGQAICASDAGPCPTTLMAVCSALGRLTCS